jgi:hypothetical protein
MKFCEEIAKGLLAMMAIIVMFSACKRRFILGPGCEGQQVLRGDRKRPPDPDGDHRRVLFVQAPVGFLDPAAKMRRLRGNRERPPGQDGDHRMFSACRRGGASGTQLRRPTSLARRSRSAAWPLWRSSACSLRAGAGWFLGPGHRAELMLGSSGGACRSGLATAKSPVRAWALHLSGTAPVMLAARAGHLAVVRLLCDAGARRGRLCGGALRGHGSGRPPEHEDGPGSPGPLRRASDRYGCQKLSQAKAQSGMVALAEAAQMLDCVDTMLAKYSSQPSDALGNVCVQSAKTNPLWSEAEDKGETTRLMEAEMNSGQVEEPEKSTASAPVPFQLRPSAGTWFTPLPQKVQAVAPKVEEPEKSTASAPVPLQAEALRGHLVHAPAAECSDGRPGGGGAGEEHCPRKDARCELSVPMPGTRGVWAAGPGLGPLRSSPSQGRGPGSGKRIPGDRDACGRGWVRSIGSAPQCDMQDMIITPLGVKKEAEQQQSAPRSHLEDTC